MSFPASPGFPSRSAAEYDDLEDERNWVADYLAVIRWLRTRAYTELAIGLCVEQVLQLPPMPTPDAEAEALDGALAHL
jgi:hypothetical protein